MAHRVMQNVARCGIVNDSPYALAVLADSPTAYWQCQEKTGLPLDTSGNGFHMTAQPSPDGIVLRQQQPPVPLTSRCDYGIRGVTPTAGIVPNVRRSVFSTAVTNFTVEWWFSNDVSHWAHGGASPNIISNGTLGVNGWRITTPTSPVSAKVHVITYASSVGTISGDSSTISGTGWHHCAIICQSGTFRFLLNGALDVSLGSNPTPSAPTGTMDVNLDYSFTSGGVPTTPGLMEHVAYWPSALSNAQIAAHYAAR